MKTYIINLEQSIDRKEYMKRQLEKLPFLIPEFITAVDGRVMSEEERDKSFDASGFQRQYLRMCRPGEIGCTLSHQKCYQKLSVSDDKCALILEDDVIIKRPVGGVIEKLEVLMDTEEPRIVLLSGWYWYLKTHVFAENLKLADVYDGFLTHAYVINRPAACLLLESRPFITADDWKYIREKGVKLQAVLPHLIDQDWSGGFQTIVNIEKTVSTAGPWNRWIKKYGRSMILRSLKFFGHFEKPEIR